LSLRTFDDLVELLIRDQVPFTRAEFDAVGIATEAGRQLIRWRAENGVVQLIQEVGPAAPDRLGAVAELVTRLNHILLVPGLDLSHDRGLVSFRLVLPLAARDGVGAAEIRAHFRYAVRMARVLAPLLAQDGDPAAIAAAAAARPTRFDFYVAE
jgi:hypothetical protein